MFPRVAVVNRGEAAVRLIHAVRDLNARTGGSTRTIALHTEGERGAMFVRQADHAHDLGPASARPYLDHAVLERALRETRADAVWVGWGFVAEDAGFAELCERIGVTFVGPTPESMRRLGDKIGAKQLAEESGVPVAPWSDGPVPTLSAAHAHAHRIGYPLMLKAAAGGGGRGIRVVTSDADLASVFERTRQEALRAFGSDVVFLESLVTGARHVEVQLLGDGQGRAWALGVRDCSVQRRNQKVIEESASPVLDAGSVARLKESAVRLALAVGYRGAGTAEFLYQPADGSFAFLEVNTRLQVEHPVTESVTGVDLVEWQLRIAAGEALPAEEPPAEHGHAVEARLNAEDPDRDFAPAPGRIRLLRTPVGPGVRVDTGVAEGDVVPPDFDSMIAKVIAYGPDRGTALARLRRALQDTEVVIEGGTTNKSFLLDLLQRPEVLEGRADTGWIDRERTVGGLVARRHAGVAVVAAAVDAYELQEDRERLHFLTTAHGGRPQVHHEVGRAIGLKLHGAAHRVEVARTGPGRFRVTVDGTAVEVLRERLGEFSGRISIDGTGHRVLTAVHAGEHLVEVEGVSHRIALDEGGTVRSPAPALVVQLPVAVGGHVAAGAPVAVLESMKMETVLPAPVSGTVRELLVGANDQVAAGTELLRLDPDDPAGGADEVAAPTPLELPEPEPVPGGRPRALRALADLRSRLLGYDLTADDARRLLREHRAAVEGLPADDPELLRAEAGLLRVFADLCELTRNRPAAGDPLQERVHSPREFFHSYLHSLDPDRESLPEAFRDRLGRLLRHYGVDGLERTRELELAVLRVFLAQQGTADHEQVVSALLQRWLSVPPPQEARVRELLDHLVLATQLRYPVLGDLARSVRFRWYEAPTADAAREATLARVGELLQRLDALAGEPEGPEYRAVVEELTGIPEPIVSFLGRRLPEGPRTREPLLEVLARRHYVRHTLEDVRSEVVCDREVVRAGYVLDDRRTHLVSTTASWDELPRVARALEGVVATVPAGMQPVVDLYLDWPDAPASADACAAAVVEAFGALPVARRVRRVHVAVCSDRGERIQRVTVRPSYSSEGPGVAEDFLVRGLHPMVGRRLDLWRLREFRLTRLPAPDDVVLYRAVSPENPSDVRLIALAQVRELSILRDAAGHVTSLPQAERAVAGGLDAIRRARSAAPDGSRLDMNHVWICIWPPIDAPVEELLALKNVLAPLTVGAGIEEVVAQGLIARGGGEPRAVAARFSYQQGSGVVAELGAPPSQPLRPLDEDERRDQRARRRGTVYPYRITRMLARDGSFTEHDLAPDGRLEPVDRAPGGNRAGMVVGVVSTPTERVPEGVTRVVLLGDPTKALGALSEPECARVIAAIDLAERLGVPVEWYTLSSGARISMDSGTENLDWVARALRRIVHFTQAGGEINIVVTGVNVGAQPYWNAESTMLMHTRGVLVMTPDSAMVLTGKQALDYSGGVSAEDNHGIGGYDRVMGPNGQAQYWAPDLGSAIEVLRAHYDHCYVVPGERYPRPAPTADPVDRDVRDHPHECPGSDFRTVGEIFSPATNPERKKPFDIRTLLRAVADADLPPVERWAGMADAETSVVLDAHLGGHPVCLLGIESRPVPRRGFPPSDGPEAWNAGTLFPRSSKKTARAINAASGNRPVVMLANLSGFDGSPESMRTLQLEYGAEIGRAIVNFDGPIVFCVVSRYHGGAFVVFSKTLNDRMTVLAVEGSHASVIGGAPAAAVVFSGEVRTRTAADPRVRALEARAAEAGPVERARLRAELTALRAAVRSEKLGEVAAEFDAVHSVERAVRVGSVDAVIPASRLRPELVAAVRRGLAGGAGAGAAPEAETAGSR